MNACSDYTIKLVGTDEDVKMATTVLANAFDDESMLGMKCIKIEETYEFVWVEEVVKLAEQMVKQAPTISGFTISGTVDAMSSGENMSFIIKYENGSLTVQTSCWYLIVDVDYVDNYDDFCEIYEGRSEEEYEEMKKSPQRPHYILDSGDGDIVTEVPLGEPIVIDLDATTKLH